MTSPRLAAPALVLAMLVALLASCGRPESPFAQVNGVWHYRQTPIPDADAPTFAAIDDHYAKDRLRVYYADTYRDGKEYFTVRHVRIAEVKDADPATFQALRQGYARDARNVYLDGTRIAVRDPATFELVGDGFGRDRLAAYYYDTEIPGSEGAPTFTPLDPHYAKDSRRVYHADLAGEAGRVVAHIVALAGADPATFKTLEGGYAADRRQVWFWGKAIAGADAASFGKLAPAPDKPDAEDARATYVMGVRTPK